MGALAKSEWNTRTTCVVDGPLAFRMRRHRAALAGELGLQILTLPLLAARLAGGFARPARAEDLEPAIQGALKAGGFDEIETIKSLPGMTRAVMRTLNKLWVSDFSIEAAADRGKRFRDLAKLEMRVRNGLAAGVLSPRDLRDAALRRIKHAPSVLGPVVLERLMDVRPVWRPLIQALAAETELIWQDGPDDAGIWYKGKLRPAQARPQVVPSVVSCANPRAEVVEALRWTRDLIASGEAKPSEIAICATTTEMWDDHFLALTSESELPIHYSHGKPALASREGQACAALADILLNGLSQERVRRLVAHSRGHSPALKELPRSWDEGIERGAALFELTYWKRALDAAIAAKGPADDPRPALLPALELLTKGLTVAERAGEILLDDDARALWVEALQKAPSSAIAFSLESLRLPDGRDPGSCVVWCPADHLTGSPRPFVRFLGMTSRSWPRRSPEDPLLPSHILGPDEFEHATVTEHDRSVLERLQSEASRVCVMSRSRRDAQGRAFAPSPLLPKGIKTEVLRGTRTPSHAFSENDRVMARPAEMASLPAAIIASRCWRNWRQADVTAHDGLLRAEHPAVLAALADVQSATSLRVLLRDPIRFVWRYVLGWYALQDENQPLEIDALTFGTLVHEILKRAVDALEPDPGFGRAAKHEIEDALRGSVDAIRVEWPLQRPVPPSMLWQHLLDNASVLAYRALTVDENLQAGSRSWTELEFGRVKSPSDSLLDPLPWPPDAVVKITGTDVSIQGKIDRFDLNANGWVRVSDYKTGAEPKNADKIVLGGGIELQRVIYALAARQLIPENKGVIARLIYLAGPKPNTYKLPSIDDAITSIASHVTTAETSLRRGNALPGVDATETWNDYRLALPASVDSYFLRKRASLAKSLSELERVWRSK